MKKKNKWKILYIYNNEYGKEILDKIKNIINKIKKKGNKILKII